MAADEEKGEAGVTLQHANSQVLQSGSMSEECTLTTPSSQGQSIGTGSLKSVEPLNPSQTNTSTTARFVRTWSSIRRLFARNLVRSNNDTCKPRLRKACIREIHNQPNGYPRLAAFLDSDENFMIYRRFGYIQARLLLEKQDDLTQLERELEVLDWEAIDANPSALKTRQSHQKEDVNERASLVSNIERTWMEYANLVDAARKMTGCNKPTSGEQRSVENWIENVRPVNDADSQFAWHKEDLITLRPGREYAWLDAGVEKLLRMCGCSVIKRIFQSKETRRKTDGSGNEVYYTRSRIERLVVLIITLMIVILLIVPIVLLYHLTEDNNTPRTNFVCIGVLLVFTLVFSAGVSVFSQARRHEILAASAAYCAVLVVFIGNVGGRFPNLNN